MDQMDPFDSMDLESNGLSYQNGKEILGFERKLWEIKSIKQSQLNL